jgi:transcriptional regulator GlxA family with amidase domain
VISTDAIWGLNSLLTSHKPTQNALYEQQDSPIAALFKEIYTQQGEFKETMQAGLLNQLICHILAKLNLKPQIRSDNSALHSILNYCSQNFVTDITLEDVARALHLNKYHISHLLNQKLGIGFSAYINTLRVDKACKQLTESDRNIADISEEAGFGSIRSFNRAFSQIMRMTPLEYRRQYRSKSKNR